MPKLSYPDPIGFLLSRKFPAHRALRAVDPLHSNLSGEERQRRLKAIEQYESELCSLSPEKVAELYAREKANEAAELRAKLEKEEQGRFFNQAFANADFDHWSKTAYWSLDEAVALSFGKNPGVVNWEKVKTYLQISPFAARYAQIRDLALRAKGAQQLSDPVTPGTFLAWAKRFDIAYPPELEAAVVARGNQIADWKTLYEQAVGLYEQWKKKCEGFEAAHARDVSKFNAQLEEAVAAVNEVAAERDQAERQLAELRSQAQPPNVAERPLVTRERETVLKLIIGMAVAGYRYDPSARRSAVSAEIASDLAKLGIPLNDDTVRKWLQEGAEHLPGDDKKDANR